MRAQTILVCAFFFLPLKIVKAQTITFDTTYNYLNHLEFGFSIIPFQDSSYLAFTAALNYVTGIDQPLVLYRIGNSKSVLSQTIFGLDYQYYYTGLSGSLLKTYDSNYISSGSVNIGLDKNSFLIKYTSTGEIIFSVEYSNADTNYVAFNNVETYDRGIAIVGGTAVQDNDPDYCTACDFLLMKTDSVGNLLWKRNYNDEEIEVGLSIKEISGNRLIMAGKKVYSIDKTTPWIIITDSVGNLLQEKEFHAPFNIAGAKLTTSLDNNYFAITLIDSTVNAGDNDDPACLMKLDTALKIIWLKIFNGNFDNGIFNVRQLADSSIVLCGHQGYLGWLCKLNKQGDIIWQREFEHGNNYWNYFADFQQTPWDNGFIITGSTIGPIDQDLWLVKVDSNGMLLPDSINTGTFQVSNEKTELKLYPNPAEKETIVQYNVPSSEKDAGIIVNDLQGREMEIFQVQESKHSLVINLANYPAGVYLITLTTSDRSITQKLLKQ